MSDIKEKQKKSKEKTKISQESQLTICRSVSFYFTHLFSLSPGHAKKNKRGNLFLHWMYNSTFPLVNRLVWKLVFLFFLFRLQLFIIINQDVCVFFWLEDGKEVTKPIGKTKYRIPLVCVISVSSNLAHFPFCCWMSKWFFFSWERDFFIPELLGISWEHLCVLIFLYVFFSLSNSA